jgi:inorganic pyrophosphatase
MPDFTTLAPYDDDGNVRVVVEAPRGSRVKLKYERELGVFVFERALLLGVTYPYDWGFVPGTRAADGDPLDAIVVAEAPTWPGVVIPTRLVGMVRLVQREHGKRKTVRNDRIVAVPIDTQGKVETDALSRRLRRELEEFFVVASEGTAKTVHVEGFAGPKAARRELEQARARADGDG